MNAVDYMKNTLDSLISIYEASKNLKQKEDLYQEICNFNKKIEKARLDFFTEFSSNFTYCEGCKQWIPNENFSTEKYIETYENKEVETLCYVCNKCGTKKTIKTNTTIYISHTEEENTNC